MAVRLSDETRKRMEHLFAGEDRARAEELLVEECGDNLPFCEQQDEHGLERIRFAALKRSGGTLEGLLAAVVLAQVDWRDLLIAAGFENDVQAHLRWDPIGHSAADGRATRAKKKPLS